MMDKINLLLSIILLIAVGYLFYSQPKDINLNQCEVTGTALVNPVDTSCDQLCGQKQCIVALYSYSYDHYFGDYVGSKGVSDIQDSNSQETLTECNKIWETGSQDGELIDSYTSLKCVCC